MATINWSNITDPAGMISAPNTATSGWFWTAILYMLVAVMWMVMINFGLEVATLSAFFIGFVLALMLYFMGLVSLWVVGTLVGGLIFFIIYLMWSSNKNQ